MADEVAATRVMTGFGFLALVCILLGIANYVLNVEQNRCEMTYMYQNPEYIPVPLTAGSETKDENSNNNVNHARYRLFVYGEGVYAEQLRSEVRYNKLTGVPVLFVPGSGGSHAQVRSLASILLRKSESLRSKIEFNVFSIDFGADFSALDGALLEKQSDFVVRCLRRISRLYPQRTGESQGAGIIVYGHSMGGVVALMAAKTLQEKGRQGTVAPLLLTFASPFSRPVVYVDPHLERIYDTLFDGIPQNLFLLSVGGGFRDHLVPSHLTFLNFSNDPNAVLSVNTMAMPLAWASADHKCIVWCRQVVLATARTLFELVDSQTKRMTTEMAKISTSVRKHFTPQDQLPYLPTLLENGGKLSSNNEAVKGSTTVAPGKIHSVKVALPSKLENGLRLFVLHNWAGPVEVKIDGETAPSQTPESSLLLPPLYSNKRLSVFKIDGKKLSQDSSVELVFQPGAKTTSGSQRLAWASEWLANSGSSVFEVQFPTIGAAAKSFFAPVTIASELKNRLFVQVIFNGFDSPYNGATFRLIPTNCAKSPPSSINGSLAIFHNVDNADEAYEFAPFSQPISLTIRKQIAAPMLNTSLPRVSLLLDPSCTYEASVKWSLPDVSSQYIRFVGHLFPTSLGLILIAFLLATIRTIDEPADSNLMSYVFFQCKPVAIVAMSKLVHLAIGRFGSLLPVPFDFDVIPTEGDNVMFGTLPLLIYFFVLGFFGVYVQLLSLIFCTVGRPLANVCSWLLQPSLYLALVLQTAGVVTAAIFSSALGIGAVYLSFLIPLFCFSSTGISWQLQRHVLSLALISLWFSLVAGPTFLHHFFLPASSGFDPRQYRPVFSAVDGSARFDYWLLPGALSLTIGSILFTVAIIIRLRKHQQETGAENEAPKIGTTNYAPKILQIGAIGTCLFASRTLHRAPTIAGAAFLLAAACHLAMTIRSKDKPATEKKEEPDHPKTE